MNLRALILLIAAVISAGAATIWLIAPKSDDIALMALPALLIAVLALRVLSR